MPETIDKVVNLDLFHPTWDAEAEAPKFIKKEHQYNPEETGGEMPIGLVVKTRSGSIFFNYLALDCLPDKIGHYHQRQLKVLKSYLGISFDSFSMAERIYKKGISLEEIDAELVMDEQDKEKIKQYSSN